MIGFQELKFAILTIYKQSVLNSISPELKTEGNMSTHQTWADFFHVTIPKTTQHENYSIHAVSGIRSNLQMI